MERQLYIHNMLIKNSFLNMFGFIKKRVNESSAPKREIDVLAPRLLEKKDTKHIRATLWIVAVDTMNGTSYKMLFRC